MTGGKTVRERIEDGMREVGTLLITFAPLDYALTHREPGTALPLLSMLLLGVLLFTGSLLLERRRRGY